jgi:glycosyltransferase involved in cell wall biosynthesis
MKNKKIFTVVIATKNEEANISRCIKSLKSQTYPKDSIEIIVVDMNSADNTRVLAKSSDAKVFNLAKKIDVSKIKNLRGAQVNYGVKKSKGDFIFFPDADMTFEGNLLSEGAKLLSNKIEALYIPEIIMGKGLFGKIRNFERSFYNSTCVDGLRMLRRELFLEIKGFDEHNIAFGPDDWDITKTIKKNTDKISITRSKIFHHETKLNPITYIFKKDKYVPTFDDYIKKWGKTDPDIKKQFDWKYRYIGVFTENGKWKKVIAHPLLFLGVIALRFMVGLVYISQKLRKQI